MAITVGKFAAFGLGAVAFVVASPARADECGVGFCVHIEDIGNPKYLHFYVYVRPNTQKSSHFNMRYQGRQSELPVMSGTNRSARTYIAAEPGTSRQVAFQACQRYALRTSACDPWHTVTLAKPAAAQPSSAGQWAAVAADGKGRWGYALGQQSQNAARSTALEGCGGGGCKVLDVLQAVCVAYAESRQGGYWYSVHLGAKLGDVQQAALNGCYKAAPTGSCKLVKSVCN